MDQGGWKFRVVRCTVCQRDNETRPMALGHARHSRSGSSSHALGKHAMTDLSGIWLGTYWQRGKPTRFELTLLQSGNTLSGHSLDDSYMGEATWSGTVSGRHVHCTKRYPLKRQPPVNYKGTVAEDVNAMQGTWDFGLLGAGTWEAHRCGENLTLSRGQRLSEPMLVPRGANGTRSLLEFW